ncbi:3-polyprenyl-4-hydroxybenzoate carboxy-lyase UbiX [Geomicrobium sp. JCM 19037]|uniref:UbiX family flavin prenyltransferase n=1 Tax=unclassified Geomicrobium TaxID=2628951 RepID=UPI00045F2C95|nr:flavin prenyltransferase UbiX [Geomicrobium sp. JCM 19037]GAK02415.1 3-polyprenyl-4-hydroxybenzoate carboxy-lyase UbiX [Geomicrobium sp. JCM 19037]
MSEKRIFTVAMSGASGAIYGIRLVQQLLSSEHKVHFVMSEAAWQVFDLEEGLDVTDREACLERLFPTGDLHVHGLQDFRAPIASGSYKNDGVIVVPCSMGTLAKIAYGHSGSLLERSVDVALKEQRPLIIVPRETPLTSTHLENMKRVADAGGTVIPAMPGFYHKPETMDDLIDFVVGKILDRLDVNHSLFQRWGEMT